MSIITLILVIVIVGILLWAINRFLPMDPVVKNILYFVVILVLILWLLQAFGILGALNSVRIK